MHQYFSNEQRIHIDNAKRHSPTAVANRKPINSRLWIITILRIVSDTDLERYLVQRTKEL
jgi:hypothetical protein